MRAELFGCPIDILTMRETIDLARSAMAQQKTMVHVALNVAKLVNMRSDPTLAEDVKKSDLIGIDGMGILYAAKLFGLPAKERVAGVDLLQELIGLCAREGFRPFFLGATPNVLRVVSERVRSLHPTIRFAGMQDGYFTTDQEQGVVQEIRNSRADCLFIAMPTPRKERFLSAYRDELRVPFIMGVGGSFDILAGKVTRAPRLMQKFGLEWLYRIYQEPRRMWWRYCRTNTIFVCMVLSALIRNLYRRKALFTAA
jgi:N-acetylglucosaminyldiphosphoundecaprenol N-acetyl-beta-D-mannosaminyltransferase